MAKDHGIGISKAGKARRQRALAKVAKMPKNPKGPSKVYKALLTQRKKSKK